jgi:hypothetical protein
MHQSSPGQGRHLSHKACAIQTSSLCLHWIQHKAARKRKASKWAVSTDSLARETESVGSSVTTRGAEVETTMGHDLWKNWGQLSGGGPTPTNQGLPAAPDQAQPPAMTIRSLPKVGTDKVQNTCQYGEAATTKTKGQPPALASMESLRGPLARSNRANLNHNRQGQSTSGATLSPQLEKVGTRCGSSTG